MTGTRKKGRARARRRGESCGSRSAKAARPRLLHGDCVEVMAGLEEASVDAVVCDPPYGIGWRNEHWDSGAIRAAVREREGRTRLTSNEAFQVWCRIWGTECVRVLKPGAHLLAFGSPRTHHRLACGLEDAGLEIRDTLMWLYSRGFSKSRRYPGGRRTTLRPAFEPVVLARRPLDGTTEETIIRHGTGALNTESCLIGATQPANVVLSHEPDCGEETCVPECAIALLDAAAERGESMRKMMAPSRFLYCSKPTRAERDAGCEALPQQVFNLLPDATKDGLVRNPHPTLKPIELMRWLVRLVSPPGGLVLDPFMGSGTTGAAAAIESRGFCGIELEEEYLKIAAARIAHWGTQASEPEQRNVEEEEKKGGHPRPPSRARRRR